MNVFENFVQLIFLYCFWIHNNNNNKGQSYGSNGRLENVKGNPPYVYILNIKLSRGAIFK